MGSKDRILRQKEETKGNILKAAFEIVKEEGWKGLSLRKIGERIEYTAPIIYEYFQNKDAILNELAKIGFLKLDKKLAKAQQMHLHANDQLEAMWMAYWEFAFENKEIYQIMYGVEMTCCIGIGPEEKLAGKRFCSVIEKLMEESNPTQDEIKQKYFTFFSVIHGLISINLVGNGLSDSINNQILIESIRAITKSLKK